MCYLVFVAIIKCENDLPENNSGLLFSEEAFVNDLIKELAALAEPEFHRNYSVTM